MKYEHIDDLSFAKDICSKEEKALMQINSDFSDKVLYTSNKFVNSRQVEDGWTFETKNGYTINVSDDVSNTYLWLSKQLILKSCKYTGRNGASLSTYLQSILNNSFTFNDWLKWKYGSSEYTPTIIKNMPEVYSIVFKMLRRKQETDQIARKINKSNIDTECIIIEIRELLSKHNLIDMIEDPLLTDLITETDDGISEIDINDADDRNPEKISESLEIIEIIKSSLESIESFEKRLLLMYWSAGMNTSQIISFIEAEGNFLNLDKLDIINDNDIYSCITRIVKKITVYIKEEYGSFYIDSQLNERKVKSAIIIYLNNYEKSYDDIPLIVDS